MMAYNSTPVLGRARVATGVTHELAEGPVWDGVRGRILWVDILTGSVYRGRLDDDAIRIEERIAFPDTAGAVAVSRSGQILVAGTTRLYYRNADGTISAGRELIDGAEERRFNDGKPDPAGRFLAGTKGPGIGEQLLSIDADENVDVVDDDLTLSNGLAWSRDGHTLFSIDTLTRRIHARDYDPETGARGPRRVFIEFTDGHPDGMTTDADDHLWVAMWGAGCVLRISPDGVIVGRIDVPAPHVSCPIFAGNSLDTLVITTATENLTPERLEQYPLSGRLFTCRPGFTGNQPQYWSGIHHPTSSIEGTS